MTGVDKDLATGVREALGALHRMSESAGEHGLYATEAALHHVYTAIDESWAAVEAELSRLREERDALRAKLTTPLDAPTEYDLTGREGE